MKLFLIGMPAVGKSTVGRLLARRLGASFADLDDLVVDSAGRPLREIFLTEGEWGFRVREATALVELAYHGGPAVVATGGGAPSFGENLHVMAHAGTTVYLRARLATLEQRRGLMKRPILAAHPRGPAFALRSLLRARAPFYQRAQLLIDVDGLTPLAVARAIASTLDRPAARRRAHD